MNSSPKIAINTLPLNSSHKDRGIGYYTSHLLEALKNDEDLDIEEFSNLNQVKNAEIIHYPWFDFYFHSLPIRKKMKTVITIHDVIPLIFKSHYPVGLKGKVKFQLQKLALKDVKAIITDSNSSKKDIINYLKVKPDLVHTIYLAADQDFKIIPESRLLGVKRRFNLPDRYLLYVGDANWVKNIPFLIEGFSKLVKEDNLEDIKLILVGGVFLRNVEGVDHPELDSLKNANKLIKEYGLEDKVLRVGKVEKEDLVSFYNLTTLYVQPSFYEGFGLPVLEALSCATPVLCSERGSLKEVAGDSAVYFNPENQNQFVSLAKEILINRSLRTKLSNLALKQTKKFSWEKVAIETKKVYLNVLNG